MGKQWFTSKSGSYEVHRRVIRSKQGFITGSVWFEATYGTYRWMATSRMSVELGRSRSLPGAQRACSRAMYRLKRQADQD